MSSINRREFQKRALGALASGQALTWGAYARGQEPEVTPPPDPSPLQLESAEEEKRVGPYERPNLLYGLATTSWAREVPPGAPLPLKRILDETAATGFNGIRLHTYPKILEDNEMTIEQFGDELDQRGLKFCSIAFGGRYYDQDQQQDLMDQAREVCKIHQMLGARTMTVYLPMMPRDVEPDSDEFRRLFSASCLFLNQMGRMAWEHHGVRIGIQNHLHSMVETPEHVRALLAQIDKRFVYGWFDTAHLHLAGASVETSGSVQAIMRSTLRNLVGLDLKDATRHPSDEDYRAPNGEVYAGNTPQGRYFNSMFELGKGAIPFPDMYEMMRELNWRGWLVHDLDTIRTSCADSFRTSMSYIRRELDPIYS